MADDRVDVAIDTVAGRVAASALREFIDEGNWDLYPEIGEGDWKRVLEKVESFALRLDGPTTVFDAAYSFLDARADAE